MATLSGNKVKDTYSSLLKLESNGVTSTLKTVEDGAGADSALKLSTTEVEVAALSFGAVPSSSPSELTALMIDSNNNVVTRELDAGAFGTSATEAFKTISIAGQGDVVADSATDTLNIVAGSNITLTTNASTDTITIASTSSVFGNPMYVQRPGASYTLTATATTPTEAPVDNNSNSSSHLVNDDSNAHLNSSSSTSNAISIVRNGLIRIDINFMLEVTTSNTDVTIDVKEKPSGGSASTIQSIVRTKASVGNMGIGFSLFRHAADNTDIYYEISRNSGGGASMLTTSTFAVTKLD